MNIFSYTRFGDEVTIGVSAPQYWWDDFTQCTEIVPRLYPLLLTVNSLDISELFSEYEDTGLITMLKDAILQAHTEYSISPNPKTEKRFCEILPMCLTRKGYIHASIGQVTGWVDNCDIYIRSGKTTLDWGNFLTQLKEHIGR